MKNRKTVITYGTFDLFHIGHLRILKRAKELGDYLIVGLSSDAFNIIKHKQSTVSYEHRKEILESITYVDEVIKEDTWEQKVEDIRKYDVDIFVMGSDWRGEFDFLRVYCEVTYLERTEDISTSGLKSGIKNG